MKVMWLVKNKKGLIVLGFAMASFCGMGQISESDLKQFETKTFNVVFESLDSLLNVGYTVSPWCNGKVSAVQGVTISIDGQVKMLIKACSMFDLVDAPRKINCREDERILNFRCCRFELLED